MPRHLTQGFAALLLATLVAQSAAADATATIRDLMGARPVAHAALRADDARAVTLRAAPGAEADTLMRAMLGDPTWPHATRGARPLVAVDHGWSPLSRCAGHGTRLTLRQASPRGGFAALRLGHCAEASGTPAFRLGTALGTPFSPLLAANRVRMIDRFGWWQVPLWHVSR